MSALETPRLRLRDLSLGDAPFILELVNEPAWLRFIGDRGVRSLSDAREYLRAGPLASYARNGFGLWLVEPAGGGEPLGICGLIRRDELLDVDLGFAFLERHRGRGYALEAAHACLSHGFRGFGLRRIVAITDPENAPSIALLEKLGMQREGSVRLHHDDKELLLFSSVSVAEAQED